MDEQPSLEPSPDPEVEPLKKEEVRFCGVTEAMMAMIGAWRKRRLAWSIEGAELPQLGQGAMRAAFTEAFAHWSSVCGLEFVQVQGAADIVITAARIDQAFGVLAWSELPDGSDRQLTQRYDTSERFVVAVSPGRGQIDLLAVAVHEIGHALGLEHAQSNSPDIMAPTYKPGLRSPQAGDIRRIVGLYGPPVVSTPPETERRSTWMKIEDQYGQTLAKFRLEQTE